MTVNPLTGQNKPNFRHGRSNTREHVAWCNMRQRCTDPKTRNFKNYGGRGIKICERWRTFAAFYADMGNCPPDCSLDRINNDLGYSPENCRWADAVTQSRNRRIPHGSVNVGSVHGMAKITDDIARAIYLASGRQQDIADRHGVSQTLVSRIKLRMIWRHVNG
jgi:hypothetical protein